jgi:hypothetical protein
MPYECPRCKDGHTQKLSTMYNMNTRTGRGFRGERSLHQSHLASMYPPPRQRAIVVAVVLFMVFFLAILVTANLIYSTLTGKTAQLPHAPALSSQQIPVAIPQTTLHQKWHTKAGQQPALSPTNTPITSTSPARAGSTPRGTAPTNIYARFLNFAVLLVIESTLGWLVMRLFHSWRERSQLWHTRFICLKCEQLFVP